ncbi:MAG: glycoside hydrolase [Candidatus Magasanikbacteria bacterium]|nr:glycoside hydrolase [Candidatus Magasanikbacteria bacterium]
MFNFFSKKISHLTSWLIIGAVSVFAFCICFSQYVVVNAATDSLGSMILMQNSIVHEEPFVMLRQKQEPIKVKGLYLTAYSAGSEKKINQIIALINTTELNAVVIDLKDYSGQVLYDSAVDLVDNLKLQDNRIKNLDKLLVKLKENNIYTIARISVFQDPLLAQKKPEWAIKSKKGGLWRDKNNLSWVDPANKEVWTYVVSIAKEAGRLGFDEVNFDYIRYPTDGRLADIIYGNGASKRYEVILGFFKYVSEEMKDEPVYTSADLFGLTTEKKGEDDMSIGQRLGDAVQYFDYVMPMVYPSHYPTGYRGYKNPANYPYEVVYNAMKAGVKQAQDKKAKLRTWIQAFNLGAVYDGTKIRAQIKASDDAGADGWILWNASNRYTVAGLEKE